ncbi:MAG TPA: TIGR03067 domain-containing protein [Pirellulales bacterium]|nr:TIGR03067 domain-containing protein [Pirellulales bacterium]
MKRSLRFLPAVAFLFVAISSLLAADGAKDEAIKQERMKFFGEWQVVSLELDGNQVKEEDVKKFTVVNGADGTWNIAIEGQIKLQGTSEIDPSKEPKTVDLTVTEGETKGETMLGIYEFSDENNTRKVCFAKPGDKRSEEFSAPAGSGRMLAVLKRIKQ